MRRVAAMSAAPRSENPRGRRAFRRFGFASGAMPTLLDHDASGVMAGLVQARPGRPRLSSRFEDVDARHAVGIATPRTRQGGLFPDVPATEKSSRGWSSVAWTGQDSVLLPRPKRKTHIYLPLSAIR